MSEKEQGFILVLKSCSGDVDGPVALGTSGDSFALFDNVVQATGWLRAVADAYDEQAQVRRDRLATEKEKV